MPSGIPQLARIHPASATAAASQNPRFVSGYAFRHTAACENPSGFSRCRRLPKSSIRIRVCLQAYRSLRESVRLQPPPPPKILDSYQGMPSGIPQLARIHPALAAAGSENPRFVSGYAFRHTAACENPSDFSRCRHLAFVSGYAFRHTAACENPSGFSRRRRLGKILDSYQGMPSGIPQVARIHPALAAAAASQNPRFVSGYAFRHTASCENPSGFSRCRPSSLPHTLPPAPKCYHDRILGPLP